MLYLFATWGLMLVIPGIAVLAEMLLSPGADLLFVVAKWFIFWGIGIRVFTAGLRQVLQPAFTAHTIFNIEFPDAHKLVTEIGFANVAMGSGAVLGLFLPAFMVPAGLIGALYLGLAGLKHVTNDNRSSSETTAMVTDLLIAVIGLGSVVLLLLR